MSASRWAARIHRLSGVLLSLFLPVHFWVLGQALAAPARLDGFLRWAHQPLVELSETVLVVLLAAHLAGGLRVLILEFLPWRGWQGALLAVAAAVSVAAGAVFIVRVG